MIKRYYSLSVRKNHGDGTPSYSFMIKSFYRKSWLQQHQEAFQQAMDEASEAMKDKPGTGPLEVISFCRL